MMIKGKQNAIDSPKGRVEVGEIDTRAPFQSVKDAVNLFGEGAFSGSGEKPSIKKNVLAKETHLHLAQRELNKLKEQIQNAETTKSQALAELEVAKKTVEDLSYKLKIVSESKESASKETESAKTQLNRLVEASSGSGTGIDGAWRQDLEAARGHYMTTITEINASKQELIKIRQGFDASLEAKVTALKQITEADHTTKANMERASELSKEISAVQESIRQVKLASLRAQQEQAQIYAGKDVQRQSHKAALEESVKKLHALKKDFDPELAMKLEAQLTETEAEIGNLQKEMETARALDLESVKSVTSELDDAKEWLQKVAEEENSLQNLVESLKLELENVRKDHAELKEKEAETESMAGSLHVKLRISKSELEACVADESKARGASDELISTLNQLSSETETARLEAEELTKRAGELKKEAEATKAALDKAEKDLNAALEEAEEAKAAETRALDHIKILSDRANAARSSTSETGAKITLSTEEFESLSRKVEESDALAGMKVAAAMAQVEAVRASENEALKRLEATQKEISDMKAATEEALKRAKMAEAAKRVVDGELRRWREREQKKALETATQLLAETGISSKGPPQQQYRYERQNPPPVGVTEVRKLENKKVTASKKVLLPNLSGIFHKKRNHVEGASPSYLPGEKLV